MAKPASALAKRADELLNWFDKRLPVSAFWKATMTGYYAPKNFNFWYYMGSLALLVLVMQVVTGIFLTMNYKPSAAEAFASVEYIMRDGLVDPVHAFDRRLFLFHRGLSTHVP